MGESEQIPPLIQKWIGDPKAAKTPEASRGIPSGLPDGRAVRRYDSRREDCRDCLCDSDLPGYPIFQQSVEIFGVVLKVPNEFRA